MMFSAIINVSMNIPTPNRYIYCSESTVQQLHVENDYTVIIIIAIIDYIIL